MLTESPPDAGPWWSLPLLPAAFVGINLLGRYVNFLFEFHLYLDMVGTALSALLIGPWFGALTALLTNLLEVHTTGITALGLAPVNIAGALVWGYGFRKLTAAGCPSDPKPLKQNPARGQAAPSCSRAHSASSRCPRGSGCRPSSKSSGRSSRTSHGSR